MEPGACTCCRVWDDGLSNVELLTNLLWEWNLHHFRTVIDQAALNPQPAWFGIVQPDETSVPREFRAL